MTHTELKHLVFETIEQLDPTSDLVRTFHAALLYRQKYGDGAEPGRDDGLRWALERAFALYNPNSSTLQASLPPTDVDPTFVDQLAEAARHLDSSVFHGFLLWLEQVGRVPKNGFEAKAVIQNSLREYVRLARENLSPGPS
jgi:hypothetical protein